MSRAIVWFRQDLRLTDNPALYHACEQQHRILPIYIYDDSIPIGSASKFWLYQSLSSLNKELKNKLLILKGDPKSILSKLCDKHGIDYIFFNKLFTPDEYNRDLKIEFEMKNKISIFKYNASLLWEPTENLKPADGNPYKIFTPFFKNLLKKNDLPREPFSKPESMKFFTHLEKSISLDFLLPKIPWHLKFDKFLYGESGGLQLLEKFKIDGYKHGRDYPYLDKTSKLSPYLHFGEISPNQIWWFVLENSNHGNIREKNLKNIDKNRKNIDKNLKHNQKQNQIIPMNKIENHPDLYHFLSEICWREFAYYLVYHYPHMATNNLNEKFNNFQWKTVDKNDDLFKKWCHGQTGIPIVDASMRELWATGYMHGRCRMIVASFLVKNLNIHWKCGADWFMDTLFDADLPNNVAGWQWVSGSGTDAAPYFRIFNPITQSQKFDGDGVYILKYCPELSKLPIKYLYAPWECPENILKKAGVVLGENYPLPIVNLQDSRKEALLAYKKISK